jgi:hypothetical protein
MSRLQDFLNSPITAIAPMHVKAKTGDLYGIELECEGRNVDWDQSAGVVKAWSPHRDGSLRNNHGEACEWVFRGPVTYAKSCDRVEVLFDYFTKRKAVLVPSNRTSTHIHFNMGDKNGYQFVNLFILFTIFEDLLDRFCGEDRNGNLFCLSSRHAEEQLEWFKSACFERFALNFREEQRYCSLNLAAINKFGTVEFRGMRGVDNKDDMLAWLSIVRELCEYACYTMRNPVAIVEQISVKTPKMFLSEIFSDENVKRLTEGLSDNEIHDSVYQGLRLVQMICYQVGAEFDGVKIVGKDFWASLDKKEVDNLDDLAEELQGLAPPAPGLIVNRMRVNVADVRGANIARNAFGIFGVEEVRDEF